MANGRGIFVLFILLGGGGGGGFLKKGLHASPNKKRGVSHCGLAIYILKSILRQKENDRKTQIFHHSKI
jgi:hypothetical protein